MSEQADTATPPAGEQIHMPGPSILPLINAAALSIAIVGITTSMWLVIAGGVVFLATTIRWIKDTVRDVNALPLDHSGH